MSTYVIGDVQGCCSDLQSLLQHIGFRRDQDTLWFTGDIINRGPDSLATLRFVMGLGERAVTVLGNHDLHCLALSAGYGKQHKEDTLDDIFSAPDADELLHWLRQRPLLYEDGQHPVSLIHAGLPPQWDMPQARACAAEVEQVLRSDDYPQYFANMYGNKPKQWSDSLTGWERLRFITNCFTRLRYLDAAGHPCFKAKGPPGSQPPGYLPWFQVPGRRSASHPLIFGHWSTLGLYQGNNVIGLDTGCLWGGALTAIRLSDANHVGKDDNMVGEVFQLHCSPKLAPAAN